MKKIFLIIAILFTISVSNVFAQTKFLVSEYKNISGNTIGEWIEILVIEDNVSIVNYYLRDNSGDGLWMGGVKFRDIPLWRNLRKGTAILIYTRSNAGITDDIDAEDGFIRVSADNDTYFEKVLENASNWVDNALNFNQTTECVHLIDNNGNHHHALAQSATNLILTAISVLPYPKVVHQSDAAAVAVRFWGYGGGPYHQVGGSDSTTNVSYGETPGYANLPPNPTITPRNHLYWRSLRQPVWNNPKLTISLVGEGVKLSWNKAEDVYPQDKYQGYLILRHPKAESANAGTPNDAYVYNQGSFIGSAYVVANVKGSDVTEYIDKNYECDVEYVYRVYAYRYANTGDETDNRPDRGRGRSYNENNFAEAEIKTPKAGTVSIQNFNNNRNVYCIGDTAIVVANVSEGNFRYEWLNNNIIISREKRDTLKFVVPNGISRIALRIFNEVNCATTSNEIVIEGVATPRPYLAKIEKKREEKIVKNDTIYFCLGDTLKLVGSSGITSSDAKIIWFKDGNKWLENINNVSITSNGTYYFIATNKNDCSVNSPFVTVIFREYNFDVNPKSIDLFLSENEDYRDTTITVRNNGNSPLEIHQSMLVIPFGYTLIEPTNFPIIVPAKSSLNLKIRFEPPDYNLYKNFVTFNTPCNPKLTRVQGYKDAGKTILSAGNNFIDLGKFIFCDLPISIDTTFEITAVGKENLLINGYSNSNNTDFQINVNPPAKIKPFENFPLKIELMNKNKGKYQTTIYIPYIRELTGTRDTLVINVYAEIVEPTLYYNQNIDLGKIYSCTKDTVFTITITNLTPTSVEIKQFDNEKLQIADLPIEIEAYGKKDIQIYLKLSNNNEIFTTNINYEPCNMTSPITISAQYGGIIPTLSENKLNFGSMYICESAKEKILKLDINNYSKPVKINKIIYDNDNFALNYQENDELMQTNQIKVRLNKFQIGTYNSKISMILGKCDDTVSFDVAAELIDLKYQLSSNTLDFGLVQLGNSSTQTITFKNNSNDDIVIEGIYFLEPVFKVKSPLNFPITVKSNESIDFEIEYTPLENDENYINHVSLSIINPCKIDEIITLKGNSSKKKLNINTSLQLPQNKIFVEAGKRINIPVRFVTNDTIKLSQAGITKISFDLNYNPKVIYPENVYAGQTILNNIEKITLSEAETGTAQIEIEIKDPTKLTDGIICEVGTLGLIGNTNISSILFGKVEIESSADVYVSKTHGEVEVLSYCLPENRVIEYNDKPSIKIIRENKNSIELEITKVSDGYFEIAIYDLLGNRLQSIVSETRKAGKYELHLEKSRFNNGIYLISVQDDGQYITKSILIQK